MGMRSVKDGYGQARWDFAERFSNIPRDDSAALLVAWKERHEALKSKMKRCDELGWDELYDLARDVQEAMSEISKIERLGPMQTAPQKG